MLISLTNKNKQFFLKKIRVAVGGRIYPDWVQSFKNFRLQLDLWSCYFRSYHGWFSWISSLCFSSRRFWVVSPPAEFGDSPTTKFLVSRFKTAKITMQPTMIPKLIYIYTMGNSSTVWPTMAGKNLAPNDEAMESTAPMRLVTFFRFSNQRNPVASVADQDPNPDPPDPHVFGPPGSGSISQRHVSASGSGSGSFFPQAKIVRKTLIPTALWLLFDFLSLKMMWVYRYLHKVN